MKKKITVVFLTILTLFMLYSTALAAESSANVSLEGNILAVKAQVKGQAVKLPVRVIFEALGYEVVWSEKGGDKTVTVTKNGDIVVLDLTNQEITDNGHKFSTGQMTGKGIEIISNYMYLDSELFSSVFTVVSSYDSKTNQVTLERYCENNLSVMAEKLMSNNDYLKTTIQYPRLSGLADSNVQNSVNDVLKKHAQNALSEGQKNAADMAQAIKDGYTGAVGMCETYYDYTVAYNQNGLFSVVLTDYQYAGGAHGSTVQSAFTFDLATGKVLQLSDLMNGSSGYTEFINTAIRKEIDRRVAAGDLSEFDFSKFKDIGENPEYYLSGDSVVFFFQQYAYFPYAAGIQEFKIEYSDLSSMLSDDFKFLCTKPVILDPKAVNALTVGDIGRVILDGNATTGYTWHYTISNKNIINLVSDCSSTTAQRGIVGAGSSFVWNFKALKAGDATITFKYYRDWEGESSATAENTLIYTISVT